MVIVLSTHLIASSCNPCCTLRTSRSANEHIRCVLLGATHDWVIWVSIGLCTFAAFIVTRPVSSSLKKCLVMFQKCSDVGESDECLNLAGLEGYQSG